MGIHGELAELVGRAGDDVLRDAADFRAAFDDFVSEGAASEGELNLLTDAIRLGALERVVAQVGNGADVGRAIELQAARLAEQRGTEEVRGPRWSLAVLCFALGLVGEDAVLAAGRGRAAPPPLTVGTPLPPPPPRPRTPAPPELPRGRPPAPFSPPTELPGTVRPEPAQPAQRREVRRGRRRVAAGAAVVIVAGAGVAGVLAIRDHDRDREEDPSQRPTQAVAAVPSGTVLSSGERPPAVDMPVVMAGRAGGVRVTALGEVPAVGTGADRRVAAPDDRLVSFTLADGPCQAGNGCRGWARLGLEVVVDDARVPLPEGGPTFVVAVPVGGSAELRFDADGYDQRVSLADGSSTGRNIEVLTRAVRTFDLDGSATVEPVGDPPIEPHVRTIHVGEARLFFFRGRKGLQDPGRAYLGIDVSYTRSDVTGRFAFYLSEVHLEGNDGKRFPKVDLDRSTEVPELAFVVPADFTRGTLVISGTRQASGSRDDGSRTTFTLTLPRTAVPVVLPNE